MWILPLLGYAGVVLGFGFLTLAIASGLYYMSELVEEHTVVSKKLLTALIQGIIVLHVLLLAFDGFPVVLTLFSAASHGIYLLNVSRTFPMVKLSDGVFILSCILVVANHFLWFRHFSHPPAAAGYPYTHAGASGSPYDYSSAADPYFANAFPSFTEISSFFGVCVWLVPFSLFVSLSASDNVLPSVSDSVSGAPAEVGLDGKRRRPAGQGMAKMVFNSVRDWLSTTGEALGVSKPGGRGRHARFE